MSARTSAPATSLRERWLPFPRARWVAVALQVLGIFVTGEYLFLSFGPIAPELLAEEYHSLELPIEGVECLSYTCLML
jgi:hypothetical protein